MNRLNYLLGLALIFSLCMRPAGAQSLSRPKLVVGIVVDQMRWDYLYRYYDRYGTGGFRRLLKEGFTCEQTYISHLPAFTAVGHTTIFTGSVPSIDGITGNDWIDQATGKSQYCVADSLVRPVGGTSPAGNMSPRNLLATTITDELMLATNFRSRVVGVSLKDRASILPAGHTPTGAFWFDDAKGCFSTSSWYMKEMPEWVERFNALNEPEKLVAGGWTTLYPLNTYTQSTADNVEWEGVFKGETAPVFPHDLAKAYREDHDNIRSSPFGNTLTLDFAKAAIDGYALGQREATDFLTINCASTDYVGHKYGPNSVEVEDVYLRLDKDLTGFFLYLDSKVGKGNYLVFLTADHGASHAVNFMNGHQLPAGFVRSRKLMQGLNDTLAALTGVKDLVLSGANYYVNFNLARIGQAHLSEDSLKRWSTAYLSHQAGIQYVVDMDRIALAGLPKPIEEMVVNGYNRKRCGSILFIPEPGWFDGYEKGTTHGTWNPQDTHIPLVFMGWDVPHGALYRTVHMTDIAPTVAAMLHIQVPNGNVGEVIAEIVGRP
ncbi:MAG TPA: alkaline phosphatase PafA [Puia sp.]|uniref:alkaline phosphatase PafA n=1 Tax=Puia sp. TaxID=2045100 RepID=UPI002BDA5D97|nr:alkaline phosphatase PafA [Puia sp.]HVU94421.1 alkaline phosphatase PafA [Puia sp.]